MAMTAANGLEMFYKRHGEDGAAPLLVIAGLGSHSGAFSFQIPAFAEHFNVVRFDNRGAGRTSAPDEPYSMRQMADDCAALLNSLEIPRAHVLGVSMGGMIAQELAINHPDRVNRLVLACTRAKPSASRVLASSVQAAIRRTDVGARERAAYDMAWGYTATFLQDQDRVSRTLALADQDPYPIQRHAYLRQLDATMAHDTLTRLAGIAAETLVLVGADDILTPLAESRVLVDGIPHATLRVLPHGGHAFNGEYPDEFNAAAMEFLRR